MWHGLGMFPFFGGSWGFILLILLVWVVFRGTRGGCYSRNHPNFESKSDKALEILKQRYAEGEISKAEFDQMKKDVLG